MVSAYQLLLDTRFTVHSEAVLKSELYLYIRTKISQSIYKHFANITSFFLVKPTVQNEN